ncbi:MAG: polysaccharide deacetylase family protein [Magnetococcales bacterium]|nr:polysaccharide deacetylase family protein [Magnetococcales bacterium]
MQNWRMGWIGLLMVGLFGVAGVPELRADQKTVYLTFDDGPREGTREILDLLQQEQTPATFFIVGGHIINAERRETFRKLQESSLVQLANHSFTHANEQYRAFYANPDGMLKDFSKNNEILGFTQPPYPTRLPGRIDWRFEARYIDTRSYPLQSQVPVPEGLIKLFDNGFVIYGWDLEWGRPGKKVPLEPVETMLKRIRSRLAGGAMVKPDHLVVLMHDFHFSTPQTLESLKTLIRGLKEDGLKFGRMRDY